MKTPLPSALCACVIIILAAGFSDRLCATEGPGSTAGTPAKAQAANAAILAYLGEPVPPPTELDPKYTTEGLTAACRTWAASLGVELQRLAVDDTEFPFLAHGVITGKHDFQAIQAALGTMPGYAYSGSVVGSRNGMTYFSINMVPHNQYPRAQREAIQRRLMIRLQMLGAVWSDPTP
jgi:hypothetical protein